MAKKPDSPKSGEKKAGTKADAAVVALRIEEVLRIRLDGAEHHDVLHYAAEKGWGIEERQVRTYIQRADDLLVERLDKKRKRVIARHVAQRQALFARAVNAADLRTALAVLADLAKMRGLYPEREVKELTKLAREQGMQIAELERRLNAASGLTTPTAEGTSPATGGTVEADAGEARGPVDGVPG